MRLAHKRIKLTRCKKGTAAGISEFVVAFYILILLIAFPMIDLLGVAIGFGISLLGAHQLASTAAAQRRYSDCLTQMVSQAHSFSNNGFAKFLHLVPVGGFQGCGSNLFIDASNYVNGGNKRYGPNTPIPPTSPVDTSANIYECTTAYTCQVGPLMNLSFLPGIGTVPGLGRPFELQVSASRAAEYPRGLEFPNGSLASAGGAAVSFNNNPTVPFNIGADGSGWNNPLIYQMIKNAGETVVDEEVVSVPATANAKTPAGYTWTKTGIVLAPGQKLWIDLRADGQWTDASGTPFHNANGNPSLVTTTGPAIGLPGALMLGKVGHNPIFSVGEVKLNYQLSQSGPVSLMFNDNSNAQGYTDNVGVQMVRIVVAQ